MSANVFAISRPVIPFLFPFSRAELVRANRFYLRESTRLSTTRGISSSQCLTPQRASSLKSLIKSRRPHQRLPTTAPCRSQTTTATTQREQDLVSQYDHLTPQPHDYSASLFQDACTITLEAGSGGHGCVSFLREKYIAQGPPNGGDGGTGGNIYVQAVRGETSLHKLARRRQIKAGRGRHGQGSNKSGQRGEDVLIEVPVGTVIREIERVDPVAEDERLYVEEMRERRRRRKQQNNTEGAEAEDVVPGGTRREKWLLYPGANLAHILPSSLPDLPRPRRSPLSALEPMTPIKLDLDTPMERPIMLACGSMGGMGNPHFITKTIARPKFATKGDAGQTVTLHFELKLLADVGLVGLPNAGKSTLLRALSNSRTRIGDWAFTTLKPVVGTVVLDDHHGRPRIDDASKLAVGTETRTRFTIADIPGLIEDAHLDKGLGLDFLRHVERASILAFVLDLSVDDAVEALKKLWREVSEYQTQSEERTTTESQRIIDWIPMGQHEPLSMLDDEDSAHGTVVARKAVLPQLVLPPMTSKPWFVVANKADLPGTQENFDKLREYLNAVTAGLEPHPSGRQNAWRRRVEVLPVSAARKEGVRGIPELVLDLLNGR